MKQVARLAIVASLLFVAACGPPYWQTSTFDQFPLNRGRPENDLIKVIALVPGGDVVTDAIGAELDKRGFVIVPPASMMSMVTGVDFKAAFEPGFYSLRRDVEMKKLRKQLRAKGIDGFLTVSADRFNPRQWREHAYWQSMDYCLYSTIFGWLRLGSWVNMDDRPKSPSEAAVEIVNRMATFTGP